MKVTKRIPQLIVEPTYVVTLEETVVRLTTIFRCTRRGSRTWKLAVDMGDWIFQSVQAGGDNVTIDTPDLLSPASTGRLDIPLSITSDSFEIAIFFVWILDTAIT